MNATNKTSSPWLAHIKPFLGSEAIREMAAIQAAPVYYQSTMSAAVLADRIQSALETTYVVTDQLCLLLEQLIHIVQARYERAYPSEWDFSARVHDPKRQRIEADPGAVLLTGLAGVSKSATLNALIRVLRKAIFRAHDLEMDCQIFPILKIELEPSSAEKQMLVDAFRELDDRDVSSRNSIPALRKDLAQTMYVNGLGMLVLDELQFLITAAGSAQKAVNFLVSSLRFDVPLLYCANYNLVHKLTTRPSEEKQRLLSKVFEIYPESVDSRDWRRILHAAKAVAPEIFAFDPETDAEELHRLTAGLVRMLRQLLTLAVSNVAHEKRPVVTMPVIRKAFNSRGYASNQEDIQVIRNIGIKKSLGAARMDLVSPFQNDDRALRFNTEAEESRRQQNAHAAAVTALPHAVQRALIDEQRGTPPAQVLPMTKQKSVNRQDIAANTAAVMAEIMRKGKRP